jgi:hypothetical protein
MVVAILYTGGARTIRETLSQFIRCCDNAEEEVHVFASIDNTTPSLDEYIKSELAHRLKAYIPINAIANTDTLQKIASETRMHRNIVVYLARVSGSIIEYKQIKTAAEALIEYELANDIQYNCIYRTRPDICQLNPFNNVTAVTDEEIHTLLQNASYWRDAPDAQLALAMATIHHKSRMLYNWTNVPRELLFSNVTPGRNLADCFRESLSSGKFVIGYRLNTYFIIGRAALPALMSVFDNYGKKCPSENDPPLGNISNWWDAEHQLFYAMRDNDNLYTTSATNRERELSYNFHNKMFDEKKDSIYMPNPDGAFFFWRPSYEAWRNYAVC